MTDKIDVRERLVQLGKMFSQGCDREVATAKNHALLAIDGSKKDEMYAHMHKAAARVYQEAMKAVDELRIEIENENARQLREG